LPFIIWELAMRVIDSTIIFRSSSFRFKFIYKSERERHPVYHHMSFGDLIGQHFGAPDFAKLKMYQHQYETIESLLGGYNVVLTAGTGSGKTEAWAIFALCGNFRSLVVYPNKALAHDQFKRLLKYASDLGKKIGEVHADRELINGDELIVATNPAYLMSAIKSRRTPIIRFMSKVDLVVFDELAFYTPLQQQFILKLIELIEKDYSHPQVVILTATLENCEALAKRLTEISGRKTKVIGGDPFKRPNRTFIVYSGNIIDYLAELLRYEENIITVVFTETVNSAEKLLRKIRAKNKDLPIVTHHSRKSREERNRIEEALRNGELRAVISPRTLEQGIDIGAVGRVVHYGLPKEPMIYIQREGRKGRRTEIPFTETVIFPVKDMDFAVLEKGFDSLNEWLEIGPASFFDPVENRYVEFFDMLYRLFRHGDESVLRTLSLSRKQAAVLWRNIQFYGYGYGQYVIYLDGYPVDVPVSRKDFVEQYQPGNIDLTNSGVIIDAIRNRIVEVGIGMIHKVDAAWLHNAIDIYTKIKYSLRERPDFEGDVDSGRLEGKVVLNAKVPNGFGLITEWPEGVLWVLEPKEAEIIRVRRTEVKVKKPARIWVEEAPMQGVYSYYTYGFEVGLSSEDSSINSSALAILIALVRLVNGIHVTHLKGYCTKNMVKVWENEAAGVLVSLNYDKLMDKLLQIDYWDRKLRLSISTIDKEAYLNLSDPEHFEAAREASIGLIKELKYATRVKR